MELRIYSPAGEFELPSERRLMGKIRIKTLGDEEQEQKEQERKARQQARKENVVRNVESVDSQDSREATTTTDTQVPAEATETKQKKSSKTHTHTRSSRYTSNTAQIEKKTSYTLDKAIEALKKFTTSKFDETVELHINVTEKGLNGQITLPHGTGKKLRIKVADAELIEAVGKGVIDFDILIAEPTMMPQLAKVARVLGPRGLMPNPKNGTVTTDIKGTTEKLSAGQINYKTEAQAPIIHMSVGKLSFKNDLLETNVKTVFSSVGINKIKSVTLKSTMSPGVKIKI